MATKRSDATKSGSRHGVLVRGESLIASAGLAIASLLLLVMGATAFWNTHYQQQARQAALGNEVQSLGRVVADAAAALLETDQLVALRRIVAETARDHNLTVCRLVLSDGRVVADRSQSQATLEILPQSWSDEPVAAETISTPEAIKLAYPLSIADRGTARLELESPIDGGTTRYWEANAGVALVGALTLLGLLGVYRRMRSRVGALGVIRDALLELDRGERSLSVLSVPERLGPAAAAWNRLVRDRQAAEDKLMSRQVDTLLSCGQDGGGGLDGACDVLPQGLILVDRQQRITYLNGSAAVYLRTDRESANGCEVSEIIGEPELLETLQSVVSRAMRCWTSVETPSTETGTAGLLRFSIRPLPPDDANAAVILIEDVTQQRVAEESRNSFVAQVSHELRTPLTNIRLYVEHAMEDGETNLNTRRALNVINQETRRLERVVGAMLSVAEIEAGKYEIRSDDVDLDSMFSQLSQDYQSYASEKGTTLQFDLPPKLPIIHADRDKISMAIHNLIGNAIKYTPSDGRVEVRVRTDGGLLIVEIVDNGIGIREEEIDRVFEKFYRADDQRLADITGSGLGLALAREVIRMHGGDITVRSQLDKGSTFTLTLPEVRKAAA